MKRTLLFFLLFALLPIVAQAQTPPWVNELHYDNAGGDTGEFIEIAGEAGTDLTGWSLVLYNGSNTEVYDTEALSGTLADDGSGFGFAAFFIAPIQNGSPDGLALVDSGNNVVLFLSYEGSFVATGGPADGLTSTDIGVSESSSTASGESLQLTGNGTSYDDFTWTGPTAESPGAVNANQTLGSSVITVDDDGGGDYTSIQAAIDASGAGAVIEVASGTYAETVDVNKPVTLNGPNAGTPGADAGRSSEAIVEGQVIVSASGAIVDGFTVVAPPATTTFEAEALRVSNTPDDVIVRNNIVRDFEDASGATNFFDVTGINAFGGDAIDAIENVQILDNKVERVARDLAGAGAVGISIQGNVVGAVVTGNVITDISQMRSAYGFGIAIRGTGNHGEVPSNTTVTGNEVTTVQADPASPFFGVGFGFEAGAASNTTVQGNTFIDTGLQVEDKTASLDLDGVLAINTFDRAVVVRDNPIVVPVIFSQIQDAVDNASTGQIVDVSPGTYEEQVVVTTDNLTLRGAGSGMDPASNTIIRSPESLSYAFTTGSNDNYPIVGIVGVDNSAIENLRVDGAGRGNGNYRFVGVGFWNAGGTVANSVVTGVRETPFSGTQHGVGVYANNDTGGPYAVSVTGTTIDDFQKNGMALSGDGLTASVSGNSVTGAGATGTIGQNGIQVGFGATGTIADNAVSAIAYTGTSALASAILGIQASGVLTVSQNSVDRSQGGLMFADNSAVITENDVADPETVGFGSIAALLDPGASEDLPQLVPMGGDRETSKSAKAAFSFDFNTNRLVGSSAPGSYGVFIYSGLYGAGEALSVAGTGNLIKAFGTGVYVGESAEGLIESVVLNENCIVDNETAGLVNNAALVVDATNNWWGSAAGPGTGGANGTDGPATTDPFAIDPVSGVEGCGGASQECLASDFTETIVSNEPPGIVEITVDDPEGIEQVRFYEVSNFTITSNSGDFTDQGDGIWTPAASGDTETSFTLTQADTDNPAATYYAQITNGCGTLTDIDPPHGFEVTPSAFALDGNYPNPVRAQTTIAFDLPEQTDVTLSVYDVMGRKVATLVDQSMPAGSHDVAWQGRGQNGQALASGVYFVRLQAGERMAIRRLTIVR